MNDYSSNLQEGMWWNTKPTATPKSSSQSQQNAPWGAHWLGTLNSLNTPESAASAYRNGAAGSIFHPKDEHSSSLTEEDDEEMEQPQHPQEQEMEHMFEKPLTPSDVGKLNRLVIPKQHAEKYFPLSRVDSVEKGLLLSFEDESGKLWRFRYSYWNSSQSYVLTKGWSRFVKEKQLDAGDVVSFERRRPDGEQLYIRWRRRVTPPVHDSRLSQSVTAPSPTTPTSNTTSSAWTRVYYSTHPYPSHHLHGPLLYQPDCLHAAEPILQNPVRKAATTTKKQVRLFGVNLDCQLDEPEPPGPADVLSYSNQNQAHFLYSHGHELNHHIQQDSNFSREYYHQMRNYPGGSGDMPI